MDNQQGNDLNETIYMAGLFDGEGYIGLIKGTAKKGYAQMSPRIDFANTSPIGVDDVICFLARHDINHHVAWKTLQKNWKPAGHVVISNMYPCQKLLKTLLPFLRIKRNQAILLLEFVEDRISKMSSGFCKKEQKYTERNYEIYNQLRVLNRKGKETLNDYTSDGSSEEIVSTTLRDVESKSLIHQKDEI